MEKNAKINNSRATTIQQVRVIEKGGQKVPNSVNVDCERPKHETGAPYLEFLVDTLQIKLIESISKLQAHQINQCMIINKILDHPHLLMEVI